MREQHTVVVKPEEDGEQQGKGDGDEDVRHGNVPEMHQPPAVRDGGHESNTRGERLNRDVLHLAHMNKPCKEDKSQGRAVVLEEDADRMLEKTALAELAADVGDGEDQQGDNHRQVEGLAVAQGLKDLDALLQVDEGDVEAKDVAGEASHVAKPVARVGDGEDPVEDEGPAGDGSMVSMAAVRSASKGESLHADPAHEG
jgi:hypothetical protein